ncbi:hypothetical protein BDV29DRAFT_163874 [Aspergillus leporis]|uniref:NADH:flavin oxidoreductase/NADH oxidase N-terminal domain-containing protein n=1 Tax=Aspergillus leporis TaxID=41062 RepID=A0A5N5WFR1_9EURO|nr:hypothetical protein BDV29DRAFT_163874 [Aspergillus leporis]
MTCNVQIDPNHLGDPKDFTINPSLPEEKTLAAFKAWASVSSRNGTKTVVQLCHPGRQIAFNKGTIAPSAVPLDLGNAVVPRVLNALVFGTPRAMTVAEIKDTVHRFADAARVIAAAGFAGVELHAAHGYLLTQFLSSRSNVRTDAYGGNATAHARIVVEIIHAIREAVPPSFCVGLKLNSVDVAPDLEDCVEQLRAITDAGIDFLEVSGGSFEDPTFSTGPATEMQAEEKNASTLAREAFFIDFANSIRTEFPEVPLLLTGGFRSRRGMESALPGRSCDLVGLARPSIMDPLLPRTVLLNPTVADREAVVDVRRIKGSTVAKHLGVKLIGVGPERDWYTEKMHRIGAVNSSVLVTGADSRLGVAIVRRILRQSDLAKGQYGLYTASMADSVTKMLGNVESTTHSHEIVTLDQSSLPTVRRAAETINKRVAAGFLPPIQAIVLNSDWEERNTHVATKDSHLAHFLLSLLLLQSIDRDRGRIIVLGKRVDNVSGKFSKSGSTESLVDGNWISRTEQTSYSSTTRPSDTMMWCVELSKRLAVDPELSNISVAVVNPEDKADVSENWLRVLIGKSFPDLWLS